MLDKMMFLITSDNVIYTDPDILKLAQFLAV